MDEDLRELAELLTNKLKPKEESSLTIKWAAIITILVVLFGSLFTLSFMVTNRVTILETQYTFTVDAIKKFEDSQQRIETLVSAIREDQKRKYAKERK